MGNLRMDEPAFSQALDSIYDAATSFDHWPAALERLGGAFGASYVGLIDRNLRTMEGRAKAVGIDLAGQHEYFNVWSEHDILRLRTTTFRPGAIETDRDIVPKSELVRSDYYNGFLKPRDMHHYVRMTLSVEDGFRKIISLSRPASLGEFDADDIAQCRRFMPHLQRAARVAQHVEDAKLMLASFSNLMEHGSTGVLLLDRTSRVVFANRAACAMAQESDGFVLRRERIEALGGQHDAALQRLIAGATGQTERTDAARGGAIRLPRKSGKADYALVAAPLANGVPWRDIGPVAFILVTDPDATSARPRTMVRQLFGISPAETRVAERLILGESPEQAAASLNIKTSTARWHLASLYRKTGTKRQAQLVRLLMSLPTI